MPDRENELKKCKYHCDYGDGKYCYYKDGDCVFLKSRKPYNDKVVATLQNRINEARNNGSKVATIFISTLSDVIKLLKEQEAVTPHKNLYPPVIPIKCNYECECTAPLIDGQPFCARCGRKVKWDA